MKQALVTISLLLSLTAGAQTRSATLILSAGTKYQQIDGFGGTGMNGQWGDVYTQEKVNKLWGRGEGQVGLNIMRIRINPNEGNWGEYGNPIKWARKQGPTTVFATPWTPPKKYKTSKTEKYQNEFGTTVWPLVEHSWGGEGSNGGAINPDCIEDFADFLERYRATMQKKGCPVDIISIQNESDYTPTATDDGVEHASYESCIYSPQEMAATVKAARAKVDSSCLIMGPECFGWGQHNYNNKMLTLPDAVNNIDIWGNHLYGTNDYSFIENVTKATGKHMWMTEFLIDYGDSYGGEFSAEYPMITSIEKALTSGYSAYVYYGMTNDFFACNHGGSDTELWKRAYVFSHYAKYATGMTRIKSTLTDSPGLLLGGSAYLSQSGDTVSVFICNTSDKYTYNLTVTVPFIPEKVLQTATSDAVNAMTSDVTSTYATGTKRVKLSVLPGVFYTYRFIQNVPEEEFTPATSPRQANYGNPLLGTHFMADPTAVEYQGRMYVYGTNDQQEFDATQGLFANTYSKINSLRCISTNDMVNWEDHGVIDVKSIAPWISTSWAPSIVSRVEADGQTHFYLYFTNSAAGIGVLTATSPTGPWTDPLGHALIDSNTAGLGTLSNIIDPGVAMNDEGEAYLTFGGGDVTDTDLYPGNARIVKLGSDMISLASDIKKISAPCHFEANELNYFNGQWIYSYCTRWSISSDWSTVYKTTAPSACSIVYMTATEPLADEWTYKGTLLNNPGTAGLPYGNNHSHLQQFGDKWYVLFHTQWLEQQMGYNGGYRAIHMGKVTATGTETTTKFTILSSVLGSLTGVAQLVDSRVNPYQKQTGTLAAQRTSNWWMVRGVNFAADSLTARSLAVETQGTGTLRVYVANLTSEPIATLDFSSTDAQAIAVNLTAEQSKLQSYLYFVLEDKGEAQVLSWQFSPDEADGIENLEISKSRNFGISEIYDLQGRRVTRPQRGIYIVNGKKVIK